MALIFCSLVIYCFRNYEFDGENLMKKRFRSVIFGQMLCRFLISFMYYINIPIIIAFKHAVVHILAFITLVEFYYHWTFHH